MSVNTQKQNHILLIQIENPPVNALGAAVRSGLSDAIDILETDDLLKAAIVMGAAASFSGGADIKEFGKPPVQPILPDLLLKLERCEKPVIAAINGVALGGGLETALACRHRVAVPGASLGLPEVKLGLIPGAGGTQRLPRLVGVKAAAEMITSGKPVSAAAAHDMGLIDLVVEGDLTEAAVAFVDGAVLNGAAPKGGKPEAPDTDWLINFEAKLKKRARGQLSQMKAYEAVKASLTLSLEEGLKREREIFAECMASDQRAALIHSFFAERQAKKNPLIQDIEPQNVETIGVLGAGTMGAGIAIAAIQAGYRVKLFDVNADALAAGAARVEKTLSREVERGRMSQQAVDRALANFSATPAQTEFNDADLIIEAIIENMDIKKKVFADLDEIAKPGAVLASNTSYLNVNEIADATSRPQAVIGMHFFSPANVMRLLEIVRTDKAAPDVLATANAVALKMRKIPVFAGVCDGFVGNRIFKKYRQQAEYLVEDGAAPEDVDRVMREFGFAMGPFEVSDLAGIDIGWANRRREDATRDARERYVDIGDKLYELGRLGQKTGAGWYRYEAGDRTPHIDPLVKDLIAERAAEKGITRREISDDEIRERILFSMINEGADVLGEGIVQKASDIDLVFLHGYGFPAFRGGPMFYADQLGAGRIIEGILRFAAADPYAWRASPLLTERAASKKSFSEFSA